MSLAALEAVDTAALNEQLHVSGTLIQRVAAISAAISGRVTFSTSLGMEDQAVLHGIAMAHANIDVFTLDTGRHYTETLDVIDASEQRYGIKIRLIAPDAAELETLVSRDGVYGFRQSMVNRKACCDIRKVRPLNRALAGASGWITGLRREQSAGRGAISFAERDAATGIIKLNPIADWSLAELEVYVAINDIPVNALHARGFPSIGCAPCTRAIKPGQDIRAGRWWWETEDGKECGLHNRPAHIKTAAAATGFAS